MKRNDIVLIIVVVVVSIVFSLLLSNFIFNSSKSRQQQVEVVEAITSDFKQPDERYFNVYSINPTQIIRIGDNPNSSPFAN